MVVFVFGFRMTRRLPVLARCGAALLFLLCLGACASTAAKKPPTGTPQPDKFLFDRGTEALNAKRWVVAREYFRQLTDSYPQSPYRADAKLGLGDTYLGEATPAADLLAANEYREFLSYYPTSPRADYAQFKLAMASFYQMRGPERDQTQTKDAIRELQTFLQRFPNSKLRPEAEQHLREAEDRLDEFDYRVGLFYFRAHWYPGAIDRFKGVLTRDPKYTNRDALYYYLGESLVKVARPAEALPYFERLVEEFEQSDYLERAKKAAAEIKAQLAAKTGGGSR
ncbi:MAG TPA: outer membrane protein assembly factor BamD [Vicinamibacterales bacterium]|nr:outer membrane protein assembly factor BamD [Vicinamibacterales bacterium]